MYSPPAAVGVESSLTAGIRGDVYGLT